MVKCLEAARGGAIAAQGAADSSLASWRFEPTDQLMERPITNQPSARMPAAKMVSPIERSHRRTSSIGFYRNSAERGVPHPMLVAGPGLASPTGSRLSITMRARPTLTDQKTKERDCVFHRVRTASAESRDRMERRGIRRPLAFRRGLDPVAALHDAGVVVFHGLDEIRRGLIGPPPRACPRSGTWPPAFACRIGWRPLPRFVGPCGIVLRCSGV